jgi:hypothetical protein
MSACLEAAGPLLSQQRMVREEEHNNARNLQVGACGDAGATVPPRCTVLELPFLPMKLAGSLSSARLMARN